MEQCCRNCKYFENEKCLLINDNFIKDDISHDVEKVLAGQVLAEKLKPVLNKTVKDFNLPDSFQAPLIEEIENCVSASFVEVGIDVDNDLKVTNPSPFYCISWE